ncbi:helix-turn-helix domain-containing protein [Larkinella sp.]|uniref:helix-turn-helix domain-containing protein n=1 Tax=Larkinella sp. TaxID=2034517 RepID=UPI003BACDE4F
MITIVPSRNEQLTFSYSGVASCHYLTEAESCIHHIQKDHILAYIYSGELSVHDGINEHTFHERTCVFIRKNHRIKFSISGGLNKHIRIAFLVFNRNFLLNFYQRIDKACQSDSNAGFADSFLSIPSGLDIESLFYSLTPYFNTAVPPSIQVMRLKLTEGIYALLNADKRAAAALFDFIDPWKIDILDFLNENFMYDLSLEEIALYTGRSLAAFKRDFKKISDLPAMKWIINKRLEVAHQQLKEEAREVSDIYLNLGFKSLSHFSTAFKKKFGNSPTK